MNTQAGDSTPGGQLSLWHDKDRLQAIWKRISEQLKETIGANAFDRWFGTVELDSVDETRAVIKVPNLMHEYWIADNYLGVLEPILSVQLGGLHKVEFAVDSVAHSEMLLEAARGAEERSAKEVIEQRLTSPLSAGDARLPKMLADAHLNSRYSFETFVVGPNCAYSSAVAKAVAEKPGRVYNPLFLHAGPGLGKTHLMQAIGQEILRRRPRKVVRYLTSETFTNEYIEALRHGSVTSFREKYRKVDVLLIDDIQFFAGKGGSQEEFFHTFNDLFNSFRQIVLTSDSAPSEIKNMESRLVSRFEWGMTTTIASPTVETRTAIIQQKLKETGVHMDDWIITFVAENIRTNIRRLEGAIVRIAAHISLNIGGELSKAALEELLKDVIEEESSRQVTIDGIQKAVVEHFDVRIADMTSKRRHASVALPRQIAMYLARELTKTTLQEIGEAFGGKNHGTVLHACKAIAERMSAADEFRRLIHSLTETIRRATGGAS